MQKIDLKRKITSRQMIYKECSDYHIQVVNNNNILFNIYPTKNTLYIQGQAKGIKYNNENTKM